MYLGAAGASGKVDIECSVGVVVFLFVLNHTLDLCLIGLHLELTHPFPFSVSLQPSTEDRAT